MKCSGPGAKTGKSKHREEEKMKEHKGFSGDADLEDLSYSVSEGCA